MTDTKRITVPYKIPQSKDMMADYLLAKSWRNWLYSSIRDSVGQDYSLLKNMVYVHGFYTYMCIGDDGLEQFGIKSDVDMQKALLNAYHNLHGNVDF